MKKLPFFLIVLLFFSACSNNPLTGKKTMAFVDNSQLFPMAFSTYDDFIKENKVVTGTPDAEMLTRVGNKLADAAQKWLTAEGVPQYLEEYSWEFTLVQDDTVNAWVLPGGKVVFYTGILPVTQSEAGIAVVMGHEIAHALLNHGQQKMSADILQQIGAIGVAIAAEAFIPEHSETVMVAFGIGSTLAGTLPFSRKHEIEADEYGAILMAIAGYDPSEAPLFWERMTALDKGGFNPQFLSTHPSSSSRTRNLINFIPKAKEKAAEFDVYF